MFISIHFNMEVYEGLTFFWNKPQVDTLGTASAFPSRSPSYS